MNRIACVKTDHRDRPYDDVVMEKVTVDTFGEVYAEPEKLMRR